MIINLRAKNFRNTPRLDPCFTSNVPTWAQRLLLAALIFLLAPALISPSRATAAAPSLSSCLSAYVANAASGHLTLLITEPVKTLWFYRCTLPAIASNAATLLPPLQAFIQPIPTELYPFARTDFRDRFPRWHRFLDQAALSGILWLDLRHFSNPNNISWALTQGRLIDHASVLGVLLSINLAVLLADQYRYRQEASAKRAAKETPLSAYYRLVPPTDLTLAERSEHCIGCFDHPQEILARPDYPQLVRANCGFQAKRSDHPSQEPEAQKTPGHLICKTCIDKMLTLQQEQAEGKHRPFRAKCPQCMSRLSIELPVKGPVMTQSRPWLRWFKLAHQAAL